MNETERDSVLKSINIGIGIVVVLYFIFLLFQGPSLSSVFISYGIMIFITVRFVRKAYFDTLFHVAFLGALVFQCLILSYTYLVMPTIYELNKTLFYIYTCIFIIQTFGYVILIYHGKIKGPSALKE